MKKIALLIGCLCSLITNVHADTGNESPMSPADSVIRIIRQVNDHWQATHPIHTNAFWHNAAYHTGNMAAYELTGDAHYRLYSENWAIHNRWQGAKSTAPQNWLFSYGETDEYVLFGDWQICFQTYVDLYRLQQDTLKIQRAREVMEYQMATPENGYWWWVDALYMVMPVMTKLYTVTDNPLYLQKLYDYFSFTKKLLFDTEYNLFFRDEKYIYPKHQTSSGQKDFWARGNGWAFAALAKVLQDLPLDDPHRDEYVQLFQAMAYTLVKTQQSEGHWSRSILDNSHAPGYETSGTAFFAYGLLWGVNNHLLDKNTFQPAIEKAWHYLTNVALQKDGSVGFVQPIGERADQHKNVDAYTTADFGVGAFLLAATERVRYLQHRQPLGWAGNSVNTVIFRSNSLVTHDSIQFIAYYDADGFVCLGERTLGGGDQWEIKKTPLKGNIRDAHNCISIMTDGDGSLHLAWDHHDSPLHYTKSKAPLSLELEPVQPMTGKLETNVSYPQFYRLTDGDLIFMYRNGQSGNGNLVINHYHTKTNKWTQVQRNLISGEGVANAYWQATVDRHNTIHLSWTWRDNPNVNSNHDICYAQSTDCGKTWTNSHGIPYRLPITMRNAEYALRIPPNSNLINQTSMAVDQAGRPYIATYFNDSNHVTQYHVVFLDERQQWQSTCLNFRSTAFVLGGHGTKKIPLSRPLILCHDDRELLVVFRDAERDDKISVATCDNSTGDRWYVRDLTDYSVGDWEPTYDTELWKNHKQLHLFVQKTSQGDEENVSTLAPQPVSVLHVPINENGTAGNSDRDYWCQLAYKIAAPVLENMSKGELKKNMTVELSPSWDGRDTGVTYMECFGRLMDGIAPWLALPDDSTAESKMRQQLREWALQCYAHAVDPSSPDYLLWHKEGQPLVDAAFLAGSFLRAMVPLWEPLDSLTKQRYVREFQQLRRVNPPYSNWLLFSAIIETFLLRAGEQYDPYRISIAIRKIEEWYVGDGWYADGEYFAFDYYNSFVIQPFYVQILQVLHDKNVQMGFDLTTKLNVATKRMQRYGTILERLISPEAAFPVFGRSVTYRMGAFHPLALLAWRDMLPDNLPNGQVRNALTQVMKRMFASHDNFNRAGFLQLGFAGHQPTIADRYTNNGSLYLTAEIFLPLGLPNNHPFWTSPTQDWTQQKAWSGQPFLKDYMYK